MKYLFIFLISLFFLGCEEKFLPTGNFYDGATSRSVYGEIRQLDFTTGKVEVISAKDANISSMSKILKLNDEELIFNARMKFIKGIGAKHYIYIYNTKIKKFRRWSEKIKGAYPIYFPKYNKLLLNQKNGFIFADFDDPDNNYELLNLTNTYPIHIIKISDDEIAFSIRNKGLFIFSLKTRKLKKISNEKCGFGILISSSKKLLCDGMPNYFIGLDGKNKKFIDFGEKSPISYLKDLDALLLEDSYDTLFPLAVKEDIWIYFLKTKKSYLIKKDFIARDLIRLN